MVPTADVSRHPYGFLIIKLGTKLAGSDVRFHIWLKHDRAGQQPNWPIHSHEINMSSYVVDGSLENSVWPEPRFGFGEPLYLASYTKISSVLTKSDIRIAEGRKVSETVAAGRQYEVEKGLFHATHVPDDVECITLCLFHAEEQGIGTVLGRDGHAPRIEFQRYAVTPEVAKAARQALGAALSRGRAVGPDAARSRRGLNAVSGARRRVT